jgi:hypothetical protein
MKRNAFLLILLLGGLQNVPAQFVIDFETGAVATGYNDVRIPGSGGTFISFSKELDSGTNLFLRLRLGYMINDRNELLILYAPLKFEYNGMLDNPAKFQELNIAASVPVTASYKFNSYRLSYRYHWLRREKITIAAGITLKIRDAYIEMDDGSASSRKDDLGAVPLISFMAHWKPAQRLGILLDGDALAAPQGRAGDVLLAVTWLASERIMIKAGYRLLEGGADNKTVYTFSMFHYGVAGLFWKL